MGREPLQPGQIFHRLTVVDYAGRNASGHRICEVRCVCGTTKILRETAVKRGDIKSCGCLIVEELQHRLERGDRPHVKHGRRNTPEYHVFISAKQRCTNPNNHAFARYGGRGIEFRFDSIEDLLREVGERPSDDLSLDRIDNNGHYEPGNVRWATAQEQAANRSVRAQCG
jgi:hypothetical protein